MGDAMLNYEQLEASVAAWAGTQPAIRAVLVVGSRARGDADRWSDLDLIILTTERERYADNPAWLAQFGDLWLTYREDTGHGDPEWYGLYAGGMKLDAVLLHVEDGTRDLDMLLTEYPYQGVFRRGVKVLYDSRGVPRIIPPVPFEPPALPTADSFEQVCGGFLMAALTTAKFIGRGDVWRAQHWFAGELRPRLLTMIEWHAYGRDIWYDGRFLEAWADPRVLAALPDLFPHFDVADTQRALRAMLALFGQLGVEAARRFGFAYPAHAHEGIASVIERVFAGE